VYSFSAAVLASRQTEKREKIDIGCPGRSSIRGPSKAVILLAVFLTFVVLYRLPGSGAMQRTRGDGCRDAKDHIMY
jgi:hypothetical protein